MKSPHRIQLFITAGFLLVVLTGGCAGSSHGDLASGFGPGLTPSEDPVGGTGFYLVQNAYEAAFVNCTGQATVLEGQTFAAGYAMAPICVPSGSFDVIQSGNTLSMVTHEVDCSDGSTAMVSGIADFGVGALNGTWQSASAAGVASSQDFSGSVSANAIQILENHLTFVGAFDGECAIVPPLSATLTII